LGLRILSSFAGLKEEKRGKWPSQLGEGRDEESLAVGHTKSPWRFGLWTTTDEDGSMLLIDETNITSSFF